MLYIFIYYRFSSNETIYQNGYHGLNLVDLPFDVSLFMHFLDIL